MKSTIVNKMKKISTILLIFLLHFICNHAKSQLTWSALQIYQGDGSGLFQANTGLNGQTYFRIVDSGPLNSSNPFAIFHVRKDITDLPILRLETTLDNSIIGSIKHLYSDGNNRYGLYQTGSEFQNYFQGNVTCNSSLHFDGQASGISIKNQDEGFSFHFSITSPSPLTSTPMIIKYQGIKVQGLMECDYFYFGKLSS